MRRKLGLMLMLTACLCACSRQEQEKSRPSPASASARPALSQAPPPGSPAVAGVTSPEPVRANEHLMPNPSEPSPALSASARQNSQPLVLGSDTFYFASQEHPCPPNGQGTYTLDWWELRDAANRVIRRQSYQPDPKCEAAIEVSAGAITTRQGRGILLSGDEEPSAPGTGWWVQLYGVYQNQLVAFSQPIGAQGEFMGMVTEPRSATAPPRPGVVDLSGNTANAEIDVLKFKVWTGNFYIIYPLQIDWASGKLRPAWRCLRSTSAGMVEQCSYRVEASAGRRSEMTFVRLFAEAEDSSTPKHVVIKPESKVEFLEADTPVAWNQDGDIGVEPSPKLWLKIRIDGQEGWIHTQEDFNAVGLPFSG